MSARVGTESVIVFMMMFPECECAIDEPAVSGVSVVMSVMMRDEVCLQLRG